MGAYTEWKSAREIMRERERVCVSAYPVGSQDSRKFSGGESVTGVYRDHRASVLPRGRTGCAGRRERRGRMCREEEEEKVTASRPKERRDGVVFDETSNRPEDRGANCCD